jgi:hypothetical protein
VPLRTGVPATRRNAAWAAEQGRAKVLPTCPKEEKPVASVTRDDAYEFEEKGFGWLLFAATMLGLAGVLSIFDGIMALSKSKFYTANATYAFSDLRTWGWFMLVVGALLIVAAMGVFQGSGFARWFGIFAAGLNALTFFGAVQAYPFWSLMVFTLDILVIYALAVYGGQKLE